MTPVIVDEYYYDEGHNYKIKRLDSSEILLARILLKIDNQDKKIDSIERQVKRIVTKI